MLGWMARTTTVLVVDDDQDVRDALAEILAQEGYSASLAVHGADALEKLDAGLRPAAILLDLTMPLMDGEEFLKEFRRRPAWAAIPIVILSSGEPSAADARLAAMVLEKPVALNRLLAWLRVFAPRD